MKLGTSTFRVELESLRRADAEDWARVRVEVQTGGFKGDFEAWLQSGDLDEFSKQLGMLYENVGRAGTARLECAEQGIVISLAMEKMGGIEGQYEFFDESTSAVLSGGFKIDQSYIPSWRVSVDDFAKELRQSVL